MLLIFDLDGTLIDSSRDLAVSTNATREHFGLTPLDAQTINSYVGNGAATLIRRAMGPETGEETLNQALSFFLKYYRAHALEHTKLYEGIREALEAMKGEGHTLGVLTNKPYKISYDILAGLKVGPLFARIFGGDTFPNKKPDPVGIVRMAEELGTPLSETVMIGDSKVDIETARNAGVRSCGVAWGFQPEGFEEAPPDVIVEEPAHLGNSLRKLSERVA